MEGNSFYEKLAKSGWLGTKAQVSADYGKAEWSTKPDPMGEALKNAMKKKENKDESGV
jgi:hypothetical protein